VLLCSKELSYAWIFNEYPSFVEEDSRRFVSQETGHLYIAKVEPSDVGNYTCVVTSTVTNARVLGSPTPLVLRSDGVMGEYEPKIEVQFPETLPAAKGSTVKLECFALGNPVPQINWRRSDGLPFSSKIKLRKFSGVLEIPNFQQEDSGSYECIAENSRGKNVARGRLTYYAKPHWVQLIKDVELAVEDSLYWECRASGKPKPSYRWLKNGEALVLEERIQIENGALTISNLNVTDSGMFQCIAENKHGLVYSSAELKVMEPTRITLAPPNMDVSVGESVILPCQVTHDPLLDIMFTWYFNGVLTDFKKDGSHFEKVGGVSSPGPPENVKVDEITDTTAQLSWKEGTDNHSPVIAYSVQARTPFSVGWQTATTVPEVIDGKTHTATVVELNPWVEYEFRVVASNKIGGGEPSLPSEKVRTEEAVPEVPPSEVSGGGGSRSELVITWDPVPEELQNGEGFGYVVAFRPLGVTNWIQTVVTSPDTPRYVFRNESILPFSLYEVKVGVYNNKGEGPFSPVTTVFSAEEGMERLLMIFQLYNGVRYWNDGGEEESSSKLKVAGNVTSARLRGLRSNLAYYTAVRAFNSAGTGPFSATVNATTKKTRTTSSQNNVQVLNTNKTSAELLLPIKEDYIIEVKATTDGGDGTSSEQIRIPRITNMDARGCTSAISTVYPVSRYVSVIMFFIVNTLC
ncbi:hypothetical protein FD755_009798, partial [Muntiacus reevesi]